MRHSKEKPKNQDLIDRRLSDADVKKIMKKYPQLKQTIEHFIIEAKDKDGKTMQVHLPKWKTMDIKRDNELTRITIEEAIESALQEHNIPVSEMM